VLVGLAKALAQLLGRLASLAWKIITNIVPFFKNFFKAVGQGFKQFASNILKHLLGGLMRWLFGEVAELGVSPPTDYGFSLRGILRFVFDILGIGVDGIRTRVEKRYGPTLTTMIVGHAAASGPTEQVSGPNPIKRILQSSDPFAEIMTELGSALSGVADNLMDELKAFIRTKLVVAGIELLVSMLSPAGAALKAAQLLIAFLRFVFENGQQVIALLNSILDSVEMVLNGNLSAAANHVEQVLADAIPLALKLFAKLLRIDGIPNIIKRTVEKVRRPIDKVFDGLLKITDKLVAPLRRAQMAVVGKVSPKRAAAMAAKRAAASEAKITAAGKQTREAEDAVQQARARLAAEKLAVGAQGGNALQQR
jgi:phage-related protein